jgi:hypothetical protein
VTYSANQALDALPNRLAGESLPNSLDGVGVPGAVSPFLGRWRVTAVVAGVALAVLATLLLWRA